MIGIKYALLMVGVLGMVLGLTALDVTGGIDAAGLWFSVPVFVGGLALGVLSLMMWAERDRPRTLPRGAHRES